MYIKVTIWIEYIAEHMFIQLKIIKTIEYKRDKLAKKQFGAKFRKYLGICYN